VLTAAALARTPTAAELAGARQEKDKDRPNKEKPAEEAAEKPTKEAKKAAKEAAKEAKKAEKKAEKRKLESAGEEAPSKKKKAQAGGEQPAATTKRVSPRLHAAATSAAAVPEMSLGASSTAAASSASTELLSPDEYRRQQSIAGSVALPDPVQSFASSPFDARLKAALSAAGFAQPSPIQAQSWPVALTGADMVAVAKTGSGKTLGFLLPAFFRAMPNLPLKQGQVRARACHALRDLTHAVAHAAPHAGPGVASATLTTRTQLSVFVYACPCTLIQRWTSRARLRS
jgi:hypothetical protein